MDPMGIMSYKSGIDSTSLSFTGQLNSPFKQALDVADRRIGAFWNARIGGGMWVVVPEIGVMYKNMI
jgi:hypothetical protein